MTDRIYNVYVPNIGPRDAKIMLVGEAPGYEETERLEPFVGQAGELLTATLMRNGISRNEVRLCNLCHFRPYGNDFANLLDSEQLKAGIEELKRDIETIRPNLIIALGNWPLKYLCDREGIHNWRGSLLECTLVPGLKVLATLHPAYVLRDAKAFPAFDLDIKKAFTQAEFPELKYPERKLVIEPTVDDLDAYEKVLNDAKYIAVDIEALGSKLACVGFAPNPTLGICVPMDTVPRRDFILRVLRNRVPKITHFGFFDTLYLHNMGIEINNWIHDTYIAQHVIAPELSNSLAYLTSVYTNEPYYKSEGRSIIADQKNWSDRFANSNALWIYNCKDVCVTAEIFEQQQLELDEDPALRKFYEYEMSLTTGPLEALSRTGVLVDNVVRDKLRLALMTQWIELQDKLNVIAGRAYVKKPQKIPNTNVVQLINVNSPKQIKDFLYGELGLKERKKREGTVSSDEDAIISIITEAKREMDTKVTQDGKAKWQMVLVASKLILMIRGIRKLLSSYIDIDISSDNRARSVYKIGPETGRLAADKYIDSTGLNMMTTPRSKVKIPNSDPPIEVPLRAMFVARSGHSFVQIDFSQAETWVVAFLADEPQMKDALMNGDIHRRSASLIYEVPEDQVTKIQRYLGKKANHSLSYGSTHLRLAQSINKESDQPPYITVTNQEARLIYDKWHQAYKIQDWWQEIQHELERSNRTLYNLYGRPRTFFGQWGKDLFKEAYAHKPQSTVADHTNGATHPKLGIPGGMLEVYKQFVKTKYAYLVNQSHDSIILELPTVDLSDIVPQVIQLMKRPLVVGTEEFTIPVDCSVGERLGELKPYATTQ